MLRAIGVRRIVVFPLIIAFLLGGLASQTAMGDIIGTDTVLSEQAGAAERAQLEAMLDRQDVQKKLIEYGVSPEEAVERVAALTNEEALQLAQDIENLPAGGGGVELLLLVIILVLLLR